MAFWGTKVMEIVKKHDSGGLVWKRIKLTTTRKANAKKRLLRVWQAEDDNKLEAVIWFRWSWSATMAKASLQGRSIYEDCCHLEIEFYNHLKIEEERSRQELLKFKQLLENVYTDIQELKTQCGTICSTFRTNSSTIGTLKVQLQAPVNDGNSDSESAHPMAIQEDVPCKVSHHDETTAKVFDEMLPEEDEVIFEQKSVIEASFEEQENLKNRKTCR